MEKKKSGRAAGGQAKKSRRKKGGILQSRFYRVYFIVVAVALIAIFIGLRWLNGLAADYESAQPIHVAEEVAQIFVDGDYNRLYDIDTAAQEVAEGDRGYYVESLGQLAEGKDLQWSEAFSPNEDERKYNVTLDGERFATFTLVPSGQETRRGNRLWQLGSVTTNLVREEKVNPNLAQYRIQVPEGYAVTVDGTALDESNITQASIPLFEAGFLPENVKAPAMVEYSFDSESEKPDISVKDASGAAVSVSPDGDNRWVCPYPENADLREQYSGGIIKLAQRIAKFTSQDLSQGSMLDNVAAGSPAETTIKKFNNGWAPTHKDVAFRDMEVTKLYMLSDDCLVCEVKFNFIIISVRDNEYPYPTEYTLCFVKKGSKAKLYNILFHGQD